MINNKLPACFSTLKPRLPEIDEHYEIRNPVFHLPAIKHKFAENSLQYYIFCILFDTVLDVRQGGKNIVL